MKTFTFLIQTLFLIIFLDLTNCEDVQLRVVTLNLWNGGSHTKDGLLIFAKNLTELNPDIIALQVISLKINRKKF